MRVTTLRAWIGLGSLVLGGLGGCGDDTRTPVEDATVPSVDANLDDSDAGHDAAAPLDASHDAAALPDAAQDAATPHGPWESSPSVTLTAPEPANSLFGGALDVSPDGRLAVGDARLRFESTLRGAVYLYAVGEAPWTQTQRLMGTGSPEGGGLGGAVLFERPGAAALFASVVTFSPDTSVLFRLAATGAGGFEDPDRSYTEGRYSGDRCWGSSLATDEAGDTTAIGDPCFEGAGTGRVQVNGPEGWFTIDAPAGATSFGAGVALSGDGEHLFVSDRNDGSGRGVVYVFTRSSNFYYVSRSVAVLAPSTGSRFGDDIALSHDDATLFVGDGSTTGSVYAFDLASPSPHTTIQTFASPAGAARFGAALATSADGGLFVGAPNTSNPAGGYGAVYLYRLR